MAVSVIKKINGEEIKNKDIMTIISTMILYEVEKNADKQRYNFPYRHISCIPINGLIMGENSTRELWGGCQYGMHAEMNVIKKMLQNCKMRRKIDLIVIRVKSNGTLKESKPCAKCIDYIISTVHYIKIKHIYYSNNLGEIIRIKFTELEMMDKHISSRFKKN